MDLSTLKPLLDWITAHPNWAGFAVFAISVSESLAVVGLFVPGVAMMFGIGALVAVGALELWATLAWAAAGAIVGDGLSYWLGHHYKDRLRYMWPFRKYPALMRRGEMFFERHGGKSVLFGRFVGPVRPVIPVVAGMLGMPPARFLVVNVASALAWAPAYTLPGVVFGASLNLASEVASRLAVLLVTTLVTLWLTIWLVRRVYRVLQPRGSAIMDRIVNWGDTHRYASHLVASVLDPQHPELRGLAVLAGLLVLITVGLAMAAQVLIGPTLADIDTAIFNYMQGLRVPWADRVLVLLVELGDRTVALFTAGAVMVWLAWQRNWVALLHVVGALVFAMILIFTLRWGTVSPLTGGIKATGGIVLSTVLYGLLAVMVAAEMRPRHRWLPYACAGVLVAAILIARLQLGLTWFSKGVAGWLGALLWVIVLGAAYRRHVSAPKAPRGLATVVLLALAASASLYVATHYERDIVRTAPQYQITPVDMTAWWNGAWQDLPVHRIDLEGRQNQPITVQWAGSLDTLATILKQHGWKAPPPLGSSALLQWLRSAPPLTDLPILPQVHDGRHDSLRLVHPLPDGGGVVLRLWLSDRVLQHPQTGLWVGTVTTLRATTPLPLITIPITGGEFNQPLQLLQQSLDGLDWRRVQRRGETSGEWNGEVLLIRSGGGATTHPPAPEH